MTPIERDHVQHIARIARVARRDLRLNAGDRAQIDRTLATLTEIMNSAAHALAAGLPEIEAEPAQIERAAAKKYRGKYPTRLREIWSAYGGHRFARTNDGVLYWIDPAVANQPGQMPKVGDDATEHPACVLQLQDD